MDVSADRSVPPPGNRLTRLLSTPGRAVYFAGETTGGGTANFVDVLDYGEIQTSASHTYATQR